MDSEKYIKTCMSGKADGIGVIPNTPSEYKTRKKQYLAVRTKLFAENRSYLASDYVEADIQGLTDNFYDYTTTNIRLSDIHKPNTNINTGVDNYKEVLIPDLELDYIPLGSKIKTMGSCWLVVNPTNISSVNTTCTVVKCNASYNSYDYYGNIITEPIFVEKYQMFTNDNEHKQNLVLMDGYYNVTCQLNENTRKLSINKRIILGTQAYHITGFADFIQEFSEDRNSCHIVTFTARLEEVTENDDMENFVAGGLAYKYTMQITGKDKLKVGQTQTLTAIFKRMYNDIESSDKKPISFIWESLTPTVATVTANGVMQALSVGTAKIKATLSQNKALSKVIEIVVGNTTIEPYVAFVGSIKPKIIQYTTVTYNARYFDSNGTETTQPLIWKLSGAKKEQDYIATVNSDGLSINIECLSPSNKPLTIKAYSDTSANSKMASITVELEGY